jgi:Spy/CpxP family protein refolding chaperone
MAAAVALSVLATASAWAQGRGLGMMRGGANLLRRPEVQTDLKLTDDQKSKIETMLNQLREERQGAFQDLRDATPEERQKVLDKWQADETKRVNGILNADQQKRFRQIGLQQAGPMALTRSDVADELKLTDDQKKKVQEIVNAQNEQMRSIFQDAGGDRDAARTKMEALRKDTNDKITALLSEEQKTKWKEMQGTPLTLAPLGA